MGRPDVPLPARRSDHGVTDGQAETGAAAQVRGAVKAFEQKAALFWRDAGAAVFHGQRDAVRGRAHPDLHHTLGTGVAAGVVDKHRGQPIDPFRRRMNERRTLDFDRECQCDAALLGHHGKAVSARRTDGTHVDQQVSGRWWRIVEA